MGKFWALGLIAASALGYHSGAFADIETGKRLAATGDGSGAPCMVCHGVNGEGNSAGAFPAIAGLDKTYLLRQMQAYQNGTRVNPVMSINVDNFNQQQLSALASYFSSLKPVNPVQSSASHATLKLGKQLATEGDWNAYIPPCQSCHGPSNQGVNGNFPAIAGQHASYITQQLKAWQQGTRKSDPLNLMAAIAKRMNEEQIEAVAAYLASQPQQGEANE